MLPYWKVVPEEENGKKVFDSLMLSGSQNVYEPYPEAERIFKQGSRVYFNSSRFFPSNVRRDVTTLYAFVRVADDLVDCIPQKSDEFQRFRNQFERGIHSGNSNNLIIDSFISLMNRYDFEEKWVSDFLDSMEMDLSVKRHDLKSVMMYMHGSAEVIGLMMSRIMGVDRRYENHAIMLGRSMQYLNFIRDVEEDNYLGRIYLPVDRMEKYGLNSLKREEVMGKKDQYYEFMREQVRTYWNWERLARKGFSHINYRCMIPVMTASNMYRWTSKVIYREPLIVYSRKVKPKVWRIRRSAVLSMFRGIGCLIH